MSRYADNYTLIDWGPPKEWRQKQQESKGPSGPFVLPDIKPFQSPLDFKEISSRSQLREHERRHGVRQCGELKTPQDFDNSRKRGEAFNERRLEQSFRTALEQKGLI